MFLKMFAFGSPICCFLAYPFLGCCTSCWRLHLRCREQQSADALWIVSDHFLTEVILVTAVAVGISAQAADADGAFQVELAVGVSFKKLSHDSAISVVRNSHVSRRQIALVHAFRERVNKHASHRRVEVVSFFRAFVQHLIPEPGTWFLVLRHSAREAIQYSDKRYALRVFLREVVERIDERHCIPTHRAAPEVWRASGCGIGPTLLSRFVVAVIEQTGFGVA